MAKQLVLTASISRALGLQVGFWRKINFAFEIEQLLGTLKGFWNINHL
jgi:hypothetical protein